MIRTSKLNTKFTNKVKRQKLSLFIENYKQVVKDYIDIIWNQLNEKYECPKFVSTKEYKHLFLSQRAIKCASTQACAIVKSNTAKARKSVWLKEKYNKDVEIKLTKPTISDDFNCELNSICCDLKEEKGFWFLQLKSIGKQFGKIRIPIKPHRQTLKWKNKGKLLNSFLINEKFIEVRYEIKNELKENGSIVGLDQGISSCITLSDGQASKRDNHGYDLSKIMQKLSNKKKGSKSFRRSQEHRKNYINWSINQLNLIDVKQLNIEKISKIRFGKKVDRFRSHWTYTLIIDKLKRYCEEQKVFVKEQCCIYRSQRCSNCGLVKKNQRQGKLYSCECGNVLDSDLNASLNHEIMLPEVIDFLHLGYNIIGFYWKSDGFYDINGKEFTVPSLIKL